MFWGLTLLGGWAQEAKPQGSEIPVLRIGFSTSVFADINATDVKAGMKAWGKAVTKERNIEVEAEALIFGSLPEIEAALRHKLVDVISVVTSEFRALGPSVPLGPLFVAQIEGLTKEECVLLVHRDGGIGSLEDLRGRRLVVYENPRASLAIPWLDSLLIEGGYRPTDEFVGRVSRATKLTQVVLPVFFRQADACLVTRGGFETMAALNPQVGQTLTSLALSPALIPILLCFRGDYESSFKDEVIRGLRELHLSASGQQILTIFRGEKVEDVTAAELKSSLDLLARWEELKKTANHRTGAERK